MKNICTLFIICFIQLSFGQVIHFPDPVFKSKLLATSSTSAVAQNLAGVNFKIDANNNGEIEVAEAQQVRSLHIIGSTQTVTSFEGILNFSNLKSFNSTLNNTPVVNLSGLQLLEIFDCESTHVVNLDLSNCPNLLIVNAILNEISIFNIAGAHNLFTLNLEFNDHLTTLDVSNLTNLSSLNCKQCSNLESINVSGCTNLKTLVCFGSMLTSLDVSGLSNLETIEANSCAITTINHTGCTKLKNINCSSNELSTLNLDGLVSLEILRAESSNLSSMSFAGCTNLKEMYLSGNPFITFDPRSLPNLEKLDISICQLTSLHVAGMTQLKTLYAFTNNLSTIDLSGLTNITSLQVGFNSLTTLDLRECTSLTGVGCLFNESLTTIYAKNGGNVIPFFDSTNPNLIYICANENNIAEIQTKINGSGLFNCHTNGYCSFTPGGTYYTIQGKTKFDGLDDGCDATDIVFPNLKLAITNNMVSGDYVSNDSGNYQYDVQAGMHTLVPILENPNYFNISPPSVNITFPTTVSPAIQDFCVTSNGSHPDMEITIIPTTPARPGFDSIYILVYKNKGNNTQSGTISLNFNDSVLDFISSNLTVSNQSLNNLSWDFSNLNPFEIKEIAVTFNANSPMEVPALNGGDVLNYTATITSIATDEMPDDNTFTLNQTVVNSFDPNDKTCLEGTTITPEMAGKYVHYKIRFENTGTANAENIVVKDMIDTTKFDISSLIPMNASHSFVTKISNGNTAEFIFENINLPFDDANNDGYVVFKIKTKPTLVLGDSFSNSASIYFDYNFPIVTEPAVTTFAVLETKDFEFSDYFSLYPNPANAILNIESKKEIKISSVSIYNVLGQLVLVNTNFDQSKSIDISSLKSGNYFIKVNSDKGISNAKFIKQ